MPLLALLFHGHSLRPAPALALDNGLALTPYMGWDSYYGGTGLWEQNILQVADALVSRGLLAAHYRYVWIDVTWWDGGRDAKGNIVPPAWQWPHGMKFITDYIHAKGLLAGIYTDAGANGCGGLNQGSGPEVLGGPDHYQQDADQFAAWGFDAVKVDFCGGNQAGLDPATQYTRFSTAVRQNASHRPMLFNVDNPFSPYDLDPPLKDSAYWSYTFAPPIANSWRTETDIGYLPRGQAFSWDDVIRNLYADVAQPSVAGPGHWNDPDYLGPENGMTPTEDQAQFTMWTMMAAPLVIGSDVRKLSNQAIAMLTNPEVLAIDQDPAGRQGTLFTDNGGAQVWTRPLANPNTLAVAFLNTTSSIQLIQVNWSDLGLGPIQDVRDLWARADYGNYPGSFAATVPSHGAALYLVSMAPGN